MMQDSSSGQQQPPRRSPFPEESLAKYKRANQNLAKPKSGKLFAGDRGYDPVTIILQMAAL